MSVGRFTQTTLPGMAPETVEQWVSVIRLLKLRLAARETQGIAAGKSWRQIEGETEELRDLIAVAACRYREAAQ